MVEGNLLAEAEVDAVLPAELPVVHLVVAVIVLAAETTAMVPTTMGRR